MTGFGGFPTGRDDARHGMLSSDADRERIVETLNRAFTEGRLTPDEHDDRVGRAYAARTYGELTALVSDVPPQGSALPVGPPPPPPFPVFPRMPPPQMPASGTAIASLICGLGGFLMLPTIPAIILGHVAHAQAKRGEAGGEGVALAGLVLGYLGLAFWLLLVLGGLDAVWSSN